VGWVAVENFNSYSSATDLAGQNGGTGWGGAWVDAGGGTWTTEFALSGGEGGLTARCISASANTRYTRALATPTAMGTIQWRMRITKLPTGFMGLTLRSGGVSVCLVRLGPTGEVEIYDGLTATYVLFSLYSLDEWVVCALEFDSNKGYRVRAYNNDYTPWYLPSGGLFSTIDGVMLDSSATNGPITIYIDDIRAADDRVFALGWTASDNFDG
jgi:hypothetical protein